jgi:glycosyltransferase involved in cell wall biosynthesis
MTIVVLSDFAHVNGGAAQVALSSAAALAGRGHRVVLFSAVGPIADELRRGVVEVVCTGQQEILADPNRFRAAVQGIWNWRAARALAARLDAMDPARTVVHVHGWTKALSSSVIRAAIRKGFRVICTLHDYFVACPNGGFFNYQTGTVCGLRPLGRACITSHCDQRSYPHKAWRVVRQVVQRTAGAVPSGIKHFIAVSEFSARILRPFLPQGSSCYLVPNPIESVPDRRVDIRSNTAYLSVGRVSKEKGVLLFAQAAKASGYPAVFVGDGEYGEELKRLHPGAEITGWLSREGVQERLGRARALVFPSLLYEAQPLAVLEAASRGVPAIVPDSCAARESVEDGVTGLWFRGGDVEDLIRKMAMLQDGNFADALGLGAYRRYWRNPPGMAEHVRALEDVYRRALAEPA